MHQHTAGNLPIVKYLRIHRDRGSFSRERTPSRNSARRLSPSGLSFPVCRSSRADSTETTRQLLPEDRYNPENNPTSRLPDDDDGGASESEARLHFRHDRVIPSSASYSRG